jgi:hypothetical protein
MQPYQEASEESIRQSKLPGDILKKGVTTALGIAGGGAILNKISPFLNKFIPPDIALKGISKVDRRAGKFIEGALKEGNSKEDVRNFIKDKIQSSEQSKQEKQNAQENRNIIEQYSPELNEHIKQFIQKGENPLQAGARARVDKKFANIIKQMEKDHKTDWSSILQTVYGGQEQNQPQQQVQQQSQQTQQAGQGQKQGMNDQQILQMIAEALKL